MLRKRLFCLVLTTSTMLFPARGAEPQTSGFVQVPCSAFRGSGSFSDPIHIGLVSRPAIITNCPRLSSGRGFNVRYYRISLPAHRSTGAVAGAVSSLVPGAKSAVHPRLATTNGFTLSTSSANGFWVGNPSVYGPVGRYVPLGGVSGGTYILGFEKLDSPLRSLQTPDFNIMIIP